MARKRRESIHSVKREQEWGEVYTSSRCNVPGCTTSPRYGKPFCIEHIDRMPYVQQLLPQVDKDYSTGDWSQRNTYLKAAEKRVKAVYDGS